MRHRQPPTQPCGTCRAPVTVGRHTVRSRYGDKPLCDRCGTSAGPLAELDLYPVRTRVPRSREVLEHQVQRALAAGQGSDELKAVAFHEAGHALVTRAYGLPLAEVRVDSGGHGQTRVVAAGASDEARFAVAIAGHMAERHFTGSCLEGSDDDERRASQILALSEEPIDVDGVTSVVRGILQCYDREARTLADALVRHRGLSPEQARQLLAGVEELNAPARRYASRGIETRDHASASCTLR